MTTEPQLAPGIRQLLAAVRDRPEGVSVLDAFGRFILEPRGLLAAGDPDSTAALLAVSRMIGSSAVTMPLAGTCTTGR